ncbi:MAG: DNA polymerase III subunit gamma/tau [Chloroflexi bacterium]|nr:DNA polymerase III subunit gamma/tau [Chloroflexota bacterium]
MSGDQASHAGHERALYLRWRPRTFSQVVSQDAVTRTLRNAVARGSVAHAYLLCGPRGTGKTTLARILYKALNCQQPADGEPCGACAECRDADAGRSMDLIEIDAASNRGIDDMRALRERVRFAPTQARTKVYIVDEAHQLTQPAWDAFLKTLEEPPPHTVFVLATTAAHKVPPTIASRCQRFDLGRIPQSRIAPHLALVAEQEGIALEGGVAERIARLARGGLRDALAMLEQVAAFAGPIVTLEAALQVLGLVRGDALRAYVDALAVGDSRRALEVLEDIAQEGADLRQFADEVLFDLRGALLMRAGAGTALTADLPAEEHEWLRDVAGRLAPMRIASLLRAYSEIVSATLDDSQLLVRLELATTSDWSLDPDIAPGAPHPHAEPLSDSGSAGEPSPDEPPSARAGGEEARPSSTPEAAMVPPPASTGLTLAHVQARWPAIRSRFQGSLLDKLRLDRLAPVALEAGVVTLTGKLDSLELQQVASSTGRTIEAILTEEFGRELRVRLDNRSDPGVLPAEEGPGSLGEYAAMLFGGQLVTNES